MKLKNIIIFYPSMERGGVTINLYNLLNYFNSSRIATHLISNKDFSDKKIKNSFFFFL
jgi:hypothetical protein